MSTLFPRTIVAPLAAALVAACGPSDDPTPGWQVVSEASSDGAVPSTGSQEPVGLGDPFLLDTAEVDPAEPGEVLFTGQGHAVSAPIRSAELSVRSSGREVVLERLRIHAEGDRTGEGAWIEAWDVNARSVAVQVVESSPDRVEIVAQTSAEVRTAQTGQRTGAAVLAVDWRMELTGKGRDVEVKVTGRTGEGVLDGQGFSGSQVRLALRGVLGAPGPEPAVK